MKQDTVLAQQECVRRAPWPKGKPGPNRLTKERESWWREQLHASLPARRDWCEEKCLGGEESAPSPGGASSVVHLSSPLSPNIPTSPTTLAGRG